MLRRYRREQILQGLANLPSADPVSQPVKEGGAPDAALGNEVDVARVRVDIEELEDVRVREQPQHRDLLFLRCNPGEHIS